MSIFRFFLEIYKMLYFFCFLGFINIFVVVFGIFFGGIVMKKFRISVCGVVKFYLGLFVFGYFLFLFLFVLGCENFDVVGLIVFYYGYVYLLNNLRRLVCLIR